MPASVSDSPSVAEKKTSPSVEPGVDREPGELIDNRYRCIRKLGRGGMGAVYLVEDLTEPGLELALKQVRSDRADSRTVAILKNEYLALSSLAHPNLASVHDFGFDRRAGEYYFTCEYVRGIQLLKATQGLQLGDTMDLRMLLYLFVEMLRGLEFIHSRGLVHGDLKPENILVSSDADGGLGDDAQGVRVKLIDFGLTKREKEFGGKKIFGTSWYIAPETILGAQVDRRTDLYSLGVVLYHMAVRKLPFSGKSNVVVLKGHLEDQPPFPSDVNDTVPRELGDLIMRMMTKKPSERYPNALSVIEDINQRLDMRFPVETVDTARSYLVSATSVARTREISELRAFFNKVYPHAEVETDDGLRLSFDSDMAEDDSFDLPPSPSGRFFLIRGESKIGKARLISEFKRFVEVRDARFLHVSLEKENEYDRKNLVRVFDHLKRVLEGGDNKLHSYVLKIMGTLNSTVHDIDDHKFHAALEVISDALIASCRTLPMVLVFSKLENSGEGFLKFLRILVQKIAVVDDNLSKLMVVATVREEDMEKITLRRLLLSPAIRSHFREIPLERLAREDMEVLLESMFRSHKFPPRLIERIYEESDGNPGVVRDILDHFIEAGRLLHRADGWHYAGNIETEQMPGQVRQELRSRINSLDPDAIRLGLAFAFLGNSCELEVASQLAEIEPSRILPTILTLKRARLIREDGEGKADFFSFTQASARELFCQLASREDQLKIHRRAGGILESRFEASGDTDPGRLANHFLMGGRFDEGVKHSLVAAEDYSQRLMPRRALETYRNMRERCPGEHVPAARDVDFRIACLEAMVGRTRRAVSILSRLLERDDWRPEGGAVRRGDVLVELATILARRGEFRRSGKCLQRAYDDLKGNGRSPSFVRLLGTYARLFQLRGNYLESFRYCETALEAASQLDGIEQAKLSLIAAENHYRLNDAAKAIKACIAALAALEGYQGIGAMGFVFFALGRFYQYKGWVESSSRQFELGAKAFRRSGLPRWEATCRHEVGVALLSMGEVLAARKYALHAKRLFEKVENISALPDTLRSLAETHRLLGRYEEAEEYISRAMNLVQKLGISRKLRDINFICARVCIDRGHIGQAGEFIRPPDEKQKEIEDEAGVLGRIELQCEVAMLSGDYKRALDLVALATIRVRDVKNRLRAIPMLEQRARLHLELGRDGEAKRAIGQLEELGNEFRLPLVLARATMLRGRGLITAGAPTRALEELQRALEVFKDRGAERDLAVLYLDLGRACMELNDLDTAEIYLEEGFYLAKKLNLVALRAQYLAIMGRIELLSEDGDENRAGAHFQAAFSLAQKHEFGDLLWQVRMIQGKALWERGLEAECRKALEEAVGLLESALERIPTAYHTEYAKAHGGDAEKLLEKVAIRADSE